MKRLIFLIVITFLVCSYAICQDKFVVVIDAGHGGKDVGAVRGKMREKDINLAVALSVGKLIEQNHKDVKVVYTRKTDVFVDLYKRAEISNKAKANLFISIHTNSTDPKETKASGTETFVLGVSRTTENMRVAQKENSVILLEENYEQRYENFDPKSPESYIIFEFMTNKYRDQSIELATYIQDNFKKVAKRGNRGVKEAGLLVLRQTACPSILIELGFINNPAEAKYLTGASGQQTLAKSIYEGFKHYKKEFDKKQGTAGISPVKEEKGNIASKGNNGKPATDDKEKNTAVGKDQVEYRVQILLSSKKLPENSPEFKGLSPVNYYTDNNTYKYTYGSTTDKEEAQKLQKEARSKFKDAFIVEFKNGKRIK